MTPRDYQHKNMMQIFLHFFKPHMGLFILDMVCALIVALVDLAYPILSRYAMRTLLPQNAYRAFDGKLRPDLPMVDTPYSRARHRG